MAFKETEKDIENSILDFLKRVPDCKAWKNQSVGIFDPTRQAFRSRTKHQIKGVSDILGIYKKRMICFEVKSARGRLTAEQDEFIKEMNSLGALARCVRSIDDVILALQEIDSCISST